MNWWTPRSWTPEVIIAVLLLWVEQSQPKVENENYLSNFHLFLSIPTHPHRIRPSAVNFRLAVYLILGHYYEHLGLMLSLERKGLLANGDYFVIGVDLEQYAPSEPEKYLRGMLNNETDQAAIRAYQSYLAIIPSAPVEFGEFAKQVRLIKYPS